MEACRCDVPGGKVIGAFVCADGRVCPIDDEVRSVVVGSIAEVLVVDDRLVVGGVVFDVTDPRMLRDVARVAAGLAARLDAGGVA